MTPAFSAAIFGLLASISWGSGDFTGSVAARRMPAIVVVAISHLIGLFLLAGLAVLSQEAQPSASDLLWGGLSGVAGMVGLTALYQGLAVGKAGVVAPITAVTAAALPVGWSLLSEGAPSSLTIFGILLGLAGVVLVSGNELKLGGSMLGSGLGFALLSGVGFGLFYVLVAQFSDGAVFYPLVAARAASAGVALAIVLFRRQPVQLKRTDLGITALAGTLDVAGNAFYTLSTQIGQLAVAAVVSSLYPAFTILWAAVLLREKILPVQALGIAAGLCAIALISLG